MKVLLVRHHDLGNVNTRLPESINKVQGIYPPLGIGYIASILEKLGHKVKILDSIALNLTTRETKREIEKFGPDIVGVTTMTSTLKGSLEITKIIKEISEDIYTVIGGPHLSVFPQETLSNSSIDFGVLGEGEVVMPKLISALEGKIKVNEVQGLVYKGNSRVKLNPQRNYVKNLDSLPFPARHLLSNEKYFSILSDYPFTTMITSRGCPFKCGYCFKKKFDDILRYRSAGNIVDEIELCLEKWKFNEIWFYDDTFTLNRKHVGEICNEIIDRGLDFKWEAPTRVDCLDKRLLKLMKKAGCYRLRFGVESGNQNILNLMKKNIRLSQVRRAIKLTKEVGIESFCFFIIGYPRENAQTIEETINFALTLDPDWAMFSNVVPYPNTHLFKLAYMEGLLKDKDYWRKFSLGKTNDRIPYDFPNIEKWVKKAYRKFYFRPKLILKTLAKIRDMKQLKRYSLGLWALLKFRMIPE
jgi:radical SAM superfamily enzyme YgiQ (UPF0313 family)